MATKPIKAQLVDLNEDYIPILSTAEQQITGVHDDNTPEGIIRTKLEQGEFVKVPLRNNVWTGGTGQSTVSNNDGSFEKRTIAGTTPVSLTSAGGRLYGILEGRVVGVRIEKIGNFPDFTVVIDGSAYRVSQSTLYNSNLLISASNYRDTESYFIIASDLEDVPHQVEIMVPAGASIISLGVLGFIAEKRVGYSDTPLKTDYPYAQGDLTTVATTGVTRSTNMFGLKRIKYYNADTVARIVTVSYGGRVFEKVPLAVGATAEVLLAQNGLNIIATSGDSTVTLTHSVDAITTAAVQFTLISGC